MTHESANYANPIAEAIWSVINPNGSVRPEAMHYRAADTVLAEIRKRIDQVQLDEGDGPFTHGYAAALRDLEADLGVNDHRRQGAECSASEPG